MLTEIKKVWVLQETEVANGVDQNRSFILFIHMVLQVNDWM